MLQRGTALKREECGRQEGPDVRVGRLWKGAFSWICETAARQDALGSWLNSVQSMREVRLREGARLKAARCRDDAVSVGRAGFTCRPSKAQGGYPVFVRLFSG